MDKQLGGRAGCVGPRGEMLLLLLAVLVFVVIVLQRARDSDRESEREKESSLAADETMFVSPLMGGRIGEGGMGSS